MNDFEMIVIVGASGVGKTTFGSALASDAEHSLEHISGDLLFDLNEVNP